MNSNSIRIGIAALALAALITVIMACRMANSNHSHDATALTTIDSLLKERELELKALQEPQYTEPEQGSVGSYLAKIRRDGLPKHAAMKQRLDALAANTTALQTLVDLYEPQASTTQFKAEAKKFRGYAVAWADRWNSVMEIFMVGGNYPSSEVPLPEGFGAAIAAEIAAQ